MMGLVSLMALAAAADPLWCVAKRSGNATAPVGEFRGDFKDFSLYITPGEDARCKALIAHHKEGNDGLWVLEFGDAEKYAAARAKVLAEEIELLFDDPKRSMIVKGGEDLPDRTDLDACGGEIDVSVYPVASHRVTYPPPSDLSDVRVGKRDPIIAEAVEEVSRTQLTETVRTLSSYTTRNSYSEDVWRAEEWLVKHYKRHGLTVTTFAFRDDMPPVVCAQWPGEEHADEYVVVGAHYDSRSTNNTSPTQTAPGADDNATGTSALLEIARVLFQLRLRTSYAIRLCSFSGEEQGLLGSRALAAQWKKEGVRVKVMVNADMLGWQIPDQPITLGFKDKSISVTDTEHVRKISRDYLPDLPTGYSSSCCSDYMSFYDNGWPAVGFFEDEVAASAYPHYHTSDDKLEYVNTEQLTLEVRAIIASTLTYSGVLGKR